MIGREALKTMITLATTAFGLVAALAWNSAIIELFKKIFGQATGIIGLFCYAVIVTIIAVLVTGKLGKMAERVASKDETK
ncbi:MAG: DUF5654 family protein [Candidatus Kerfeldbacteria bacterium]